jgi:hypothetical protein
VDRMYPILIAPCAILYAVGSVIALGFFPATAVLEMLPIGLLLAGFGGPLLLIIASGLFFALMLCTYSIRNSVKSFWPRIVRKRGWMPRAEMVKLAEKEAREANNAKRQKAANVFRPFVGLLLATPSEPLKAALSDLDSQCDRWLAHEEEFSEAARTRIWHALKTASQQAQAMRDDQALLENEQAQASYLAVVQRLHRMLVSECDSRVERKLVGLQDSLDTLDEQLSSLKDYEMDPAA